MHEISKTVKRRPSLHGIKCPDPANSGVRSLQELKMRFNIEKGCTSCLRCQCGRLLEIPEKDRNPDCLTFLQDLAHRACGSCGIFGLCSEAIAYAM